MRSAPNGSWPTTRGVMRSRICLTARMASGPPWERNGPWASPIPTRPASVVSRTMSSLTLLIVEVDVRTGCGSGAERKYVSSAVIFISSLRRGSRVEESGCSVSAPRQAEQHQKQVDEVEIERERADDGVAGELPLRQLERHLLQALRVVGGQSLEQYHANHRDQELQRVVVPEDPDDGRENQSDQPHHHELAHAGQAALGGRAEERQRAEHA